MFDVVVHASTRPETFGLSIAEALVAAAGGAAELFTPGHDGIGHAPGDAATLLAGASRTVGRRRAAVPARCGQAADAVAPFSQVSHGREIAAVYADWLRGRYTKVVRRT